MIDIMWIGDKYAQFWRKQVIMKVYKNDTVLDVQKRFKEEYSLLDIKFYSVEHDHYLGSAKKDEVDENHMLISLNSSLVDGNVDISPSITVDEMETSFEKDFGLHVQVFRKSGDQWLQTSVTDHWTLMKHLEKAQESEEFTRVN